MNLKKAIFTAALTVGLVMAGGTAMATKEAEDFIRLCGNGTPQEVAAAIQAGADVNGAADMGETPLQGALANANPKVIHALLRAGANVNKNNTNEVGETLLMQAILNNKPEAVLILLKAGADVHARDHAGKTALDHAIKNEKFMKTEAFKQLKAASQK